MAAKRFLLTGYGTRDNATLNIRGFLWNPELDDFEKLITQTTIDLDQSIYIDGVKVGNHGLIVWGKHGFSKGAIAEVFSDETGLAYQANFHTSTIPPS